MTADSLDSEYDAAIEFIFSRLNYERAPGLAKSLSDFKLTRMEQLLAALGNPQEQVPTVHVAGSKGKGSSSSMIASIFQTAGYQVGLFTSPHVVNYEERFTINGVRPDPTRLVSYIKKIRPVVDDMDANLDRRGPTFFEISTAIGWLYFAESKVDLAVIEVGLGGRLDSTNVCQPLVSVITSISLDHTHLLGDTEALIAREKAGIIKPSVPVVSGVCAEEPAQVIKEIAENNGSPLYVLGQDFQVIPQRCKTGSDGALPKYHFDFSTEDSSDSIEQIPVGLPGAHQVRNAALAVKAVHLLSTEFPKVDESVIRIGIERVRCPLRVEVMSREPLVIIDTAHNAASIQALCETLNSVEVKKRIAVLSFSKDKDVADLLRRLNPHFDQFYLTAYANPRAVSVEDLKENAQQYLSKPWMTAEDSTTAVTQALEACSPRDLLCITGSFFLAAEVEPRFRQQNS